MIIDKKALLICGLLITSCDHGSDGNQNPSAGSGSEPGISPPSSPDSGGGGGSRGGQPSNQPRWTQPNLPQRPGSNGTASTQHDFEQGVRNSDPDFVRRSIASGKYVVTSQNIADALRLKSEHEVIQMLDVLLPTITFKHRKPKLDTSMGLSGDYFRKVALERGFVEAAMKLLPAEFKNKQEKLGELFIDVIDDPAKVKQIISAGLLVNEPMAGGYPPLHFVARDFSVSWPSLDTMDVLFKAGAQLDKKIRVPNGAFGETPLHLAAATCKDKEIKKLLALGANANIQNDDGETPLHLVAKACSYQPVYEMLQAKGLDLTIVDKKNQTAYDVLKDDNLKDLFS